MRLFKGQSHNPEREEQQPARSQQPDASNLNRQPSPTGPLLSPSDVLHLQRLIGNRAVTRMLQGEQRPAVQRYIQTQTFSSKSKANQKSGVEKLKAIIGAQHGWSRGSDPIPGQPADIKNVGPLKGRYVGGHMLNEEVGGLGNWRNMIVQSSASNSQMNLHDNIIKRLGMKASTKELYSKGTTEYGVKEKIKVHPPNPDGTENFTGETKVPEAIEVTLEPVKRASPTASLVPWPASDHGETINNPYIVQNVPPYPPLPSKIAAQSKTAQKQKQAKQDKVALARLKGSAATTLSAAQLQLVPGIGQVKAQAIHTYLQNNQTSLQALYAAKPTGHGFNQTDIALLMQYFT